MIKKLTISLITIVYALSFCNVAISQSELNNESFQFIVWADVQGQDMRQFSAFSDRMADRDIVFTLFAGDLENAGFTPEGIAEWRSALNGELTGDPAPNGMFDKTFPVRGNHDRNEPEAWQEYFEIAAIARNVGVAKYQAMPHHEDLVYSFDHQNSHFVGLDVIGDSDRLQPDQIHWLDEDLTRAEARGITHSFIFFHGPLYGVGTHSRYSIRVAPIEHVVRDLVMVINAHPSITALFHGHEHIFSSTYLDASRIPELTRGVWQIVVPSAGAWSRACNKPDRSDHCERLKGFCLVTVSDDEVTVDLYSNDEQPVYREVIVDNLGARSKMHDTR